MPGRVPLSGFRGDVSAVNGEQVRAAQRSFLVAAATGTPAAAVRTIAELLDRGADVHTVIHRVLIPVQREAGARGLAGSWGMAEEALCCAAVEESLSLLDGVLPIVASRGHVVVGCAEGEDHGLPARMVATELRQAGWRVACLPRPLPSAELRAYLGMARPDALLLTCTVAENLPGAAASVAAAHATGVPVVVGGAAFGSDDLRARRVGADGWATSAAGAARLLDSLPRQTRDARIRLSRAGDEGERLVAASPLLAEIAAGALAVMAGGDVPGLSIDRVGRLLRTVAAALIVSDERILETYLEWLERACVARGGHPYFVYQLLLAVEAGLPETFRLAVELVRQAVDHVAARAGREASPPMRSTVPPTRAVVPLNEAARLAALAAFDMPDADLEADLAPLVELAAAVTGAPVAFLSFIDGDTQRFKVIRGARLSSLSRGEAICAHTLLQSHVTVIPDMAAHPIFSANPLVVDSPRWRFYAGAPVLVGGDLAIGSLAVADYQPRTLTAGQYRSLKTVAEEVSAHLELARRQLSQGRVEASARRSVGEAVAGGLDLRERPDGTPADLLSTREVADLFRVSPRTVANWAAGGKLPTVQTAGGHYRFAPDAVMDLLLEGGALPDAVR